MQSRPRPILLARGPENNEIRSALGSPILGNFLKDRRACARADWTSRQGAIFPFDIHSMAMYSAAMIEKELVAASTEPLILSLLAKGESCGYELIQEIKRLSGRGNPVDGRDVLERTTCLTSNPPSRNGGGRCWPRVSKPAGVWRNWKVICGRKSARWKSAGASEAVAFEQASPAWAARTRCTRSSTRSASAMSGR